MLKRLQPYVGQSLITVEGRGMLGVPGVAARTFRGGGGYWHQRPIDHPGFLRAVDLFSRAY